jgi:hypothetical protein
MKQGVAPHAQCWLSRDIQSCVQWNQLRNEASEATSCLAVIITPLACQLLSKSIGFLLKSA